MGLFSISIYACPNLILILDIGHTSDKTTNTNEYFRLRLKRSQYFLYMRNYKMVCIIWLVSVSDDFQRWNIGSILVIKVKTTLLDYNRTDNNCARWEESIFRIQYIIFFVCPWAQDKRRVFQYEPPCIYKSQSGVHYVGLVRKINYFFRQKWKAL